jgi:CHAT domain-containing protein
MQRWRLVLPGLLLVLAAGWPVSSALAQAEPVALRQEYFIEQRPGEELLIRISGTEASFQTRVYASGRDLIALAGIPESRIAPLFIYVKSRQAGRQLDIEVTAAQATARSRFDLGVSRMNVFDERSRLLATAYELLSTGLAVPADDSPASWSVKTNSLINAGRLFAEFGMEELRLWSEYYASLLMLRELGDSYSALSGVEGILQDPGSRRQPRLALAARLLEAEIMAVLRAAGELPPVDGEQDPLQQSAAAAVSQAIALDEAFAQAWALDLSARDFAQRGLVQQALGNFQASLDIADRIGAADLATVVREALVDIHGEQGDRAASAVVLKEIESQLQQDGAGDDLAQNLLEQGRLYNQAAQYSRAIDALQRALEFERNSVTRDQVRLALAEALYQGGRLDEAFEQAAAAVQNPASGAWRQRTPVLDVAAGIGIMAGVYRARGEFVAMRSARAAQAERLDDGQRAGFDYQRLLDELASGRSTTGVAGLLQALQRHEQAPWAALGQLQQCALATGCDATAARRARDTLTSQGFDRDAAEASLLYANWQQATDNSAAALDSLEALLGDMLALRQREPEALGAWYWQRLPALRAAYLDPLLTNATPARALLGLASMRAVMAAWAAPLAPGRVAPAIPDARQLDDMLAGLGSGEGLLDFYLGEQGAWVLLAGSNGVQRWRLDNSGALREQVQVLNERMPVLDGAAFDRAAATLGQQLLGPLPAQLPARLYWLGGAPLAAISPAALRRNGRYLASEHTLVRLSNLPVRLPARQQGLGGAVQQVFVAGRPQDFSGEYLQRLETSLEMRAVSDQFIGPGLTIIQGEALLPDEFAGTQFSNAQVVHLAMPALVDLQRPQASWLQLSEAIRGEGRVLMGPPELAVLTLQGGLVVLSQAQFSALDNGGAANRLPLVADLLAAGADAVMATLWRADDQSSADFAGDFYRALVAGNSPDLALAMAQRKAMASGGEQRDWARYQLYSR